MRIYNLTDHPSLTSRSIRVRGGEIPAGHSISTDYDEKLEGLKGILAIDELPKWYADWKESYKPQKVCLELLKNRFFDKPREVVYKLLDEMPITVIKDKPDKKK